MPRPSIHHRRANCEQQSAIQFDVPARSQLRIRDVQRRAAGLFELPDCSGSFSLTSLSMVVGQPMASTLLERGSARTFDWNNSDRVYSQILQPSRCSRGATMPGVTSDSHVIGRTMLVGAAPRSGDRPDSITRWRVFRNTCSASLSWLDPPNSNSRAG